MWNGVISVNRDTHDTESQERVKHYEELLRHLADEGVEISGLDYDDESLYATAVMEKNFRAPYGRDMCIVFEYNSETREGEYGGVNFTPSSPAQCVSQATLRRYARERKERSPVIFSFDEGDEPANEDDLRTEIKRMRFSRGMWEKRTDE